MVRGLEFIMDGFCIVLFEFIDMVAMELFIAPREESDGAEVFPQAIGLVAEDVEVLLEPQGLWTAAPQFTLEGCI